MKSALLLIAFVAAARAQIPYTNCGAPTDLMVLTLVDAAPFPPTTNSTVQFLIQGPTSGPIVAANAKLQVYLFGLEIENQDHDLCTWIAEAGDLCPKTPGQAVSVSAAFEIPAITPPGQYTVRMSAIENLTVRQVFCVEAVVQVSRP